MKEERIDTTRMEKGFEFAERIFYEKIDDSKYGKFAPSNIALAAYPYIPDPLGGFSRYCSDLINYRRNALNINLFINDEAYYAAARYIADDVNARLQYLSKLPPFSYRENTYMDENLASYKKTLQWHLDEFNSKSESAIKRKKSIMPQLEQMAYDEDAKRTNDKDVERANAMKKKGFIGFGKGLIDKIKSYAIIDERKTLEGGE